MTEPDPSPSPAPQSVPSSDAELVLEGRITTASNATFLASIDGTQVVYKPIEGERPLWDFPDGDLASREVAAYLVSERTGWDVVPRTWLRDGPFGPGMVQLWQEIDPDQDPVDLLSPAAAAAGGWLTVFEGEDDRDRPVSLVHEDSAALRRMAVFDVVTNNADRKGNHVLAMPNGHRYGCDHGLTFHQEPKLRTVLWGWVDEELTEAERAGVAAVLDGIDDELGLALTDLITDAEIDALALRCSELLAAGRFPAPRGYGPAVPWPLF